MKISTIGLTLVALAAWLPVGSLLADYQCGPNYETYQVFNSQFSTSQGTGVRCVHFTNPNDRTQFIWYGEGYWGNNTYRHLGDAMHSGSGRAEATDIYGNGESGSGVATNLVITTSAGSGGLIPAIIRVGGQWNEAWLRMANGNVTGYRSTLAPISSCGQHLVKYSAYTPIDLSYRPNNSYIGVRCKMPNLTTWVGAGERGGNPYFHMGSFDGSGVGAFDICLGGNYLCGHYDFGQLTLRSIFVNLQDDYEIPQWNEDWLLN